MIKMIKKRQLYKLLNMKGRLPGICVENPANFLLIINAGKVSNLYI